ncbi:M23 family metallopeptidase [Streptomyces sp. NPDC020951]|uniref:M23 family metallopeptidase n=1 Tax=Streptomyces sp. NPDC020951 TaxID=3365104 RepID=UPI003795237D
MNDRHPSGIMTTPAPASDPAAAHYASYGAQEAQYDGFTTYPGYETGSYDTGAHGTGHFQAADPLFGELPGDGTNQATGTYDTGAQWSTDGHQDHQSHQAPDTGSHQTLNYDAYAAQHHAAYDSGAYDATAWSTGQHQHLSAVPQQATAPDGSGQWDASAWLQPDQSGSPADQTQHWEWGTQAFDTGAYDATQWNSDGGESAQAAQPAQSAQAADEYEQQAEVPFDQQATATFEHVGYDDAAPAEGESSDDAPLPLLDEQEDAAPAPVGRAATRNANRSRRRMPAKRSALLTVAVPSACVMGVAGIAAASVGTLTGGDSDKDTTASASDAQPVKPSAANNKLDSQLETLSAGADDFADRASRTQERIDLKTQQEAEKKKAAAEAARKERLRPKYALPVAKHGLSAYFGQAGINWMSQHTGIDFPVSYGTTVMAATDGTVRTQWNSAYGNMMIVTAKDGTETWYCHLSSYRIASGTTVKAGDPIAYSGNSGNSTGPHLHFEVRPAGGSPIDPLPWLRSHGLNPT